MELMRVKLATQLFSRSMASARKYYTKVNILHTNTTAGTITFTERMNDLFDAMNRQHPKEGLRIGCRDLECIENSLNWLDDWERDVRSAAISQDTFLTQSTAEGLRVTMLSMLEISEYLLNQCGFKYVLTGKLNQDPLERFFGKARQAGCENDHPDMLTFLQVYRMLTVYSLLKPPKLGNCEVPEEKSVLDLSSFRTIFMKQDSGDSRRSHLSELKTKLDRLVETEEWELEDCDNLVQESNNSAEVVDAVLYYVTGFLTRKVARMFSCKKCRQSLTVDAPTMKEASLTLCKTRGGLVHPNSRLYKILRCAEDYFANNMNSTDIFWATIDHVVDNFKLTFPCGEHKNGAIARILYYYVGLRMRQHCVNEARDKEHTASAKKKLSRLCKV
ncbi:hypothetical protein HPB49_013897 [Dermacentor silvarum]|uniref:Uncharacterized protein n=1 Tax=Dermacentor silvarum TaxID=543639 RepID=A0ACB8DDS6_DERSI|nr:hypothetical protein HPB49_013897 [Dermacentor silvarum]